MAEQEEKGIEVGTSTDRTLVPGMWASPHPVGPIGSELLADVARFGDLPLADGSEHYDIVERDYSDFGEDTHTIASGYSEPYTRD